MEESASNDLEPDLERYGKGRRASGKRAEEGPVVVDVDVEGIRRSDSGSLIKEEQRREG